MAKSIAVATKVAYVAPVERVDENGTSSIVAWKIGFKDSFEGFRIKNGVLIPCQVNFIALPASVASATLRSLDERLDVMENFTAKRANLLFSGASVELERVHHTDTDKYTDSFGVECQYEHEGWDTTFKSVKFTSDVDAILGDYRTARLARLLSED